jgi:hypothetical protein
MMTKIESSASASSENITQRVVLLLLDALALRLPVSLEIEFSSYFHSYIPVQIGATEVTFWTRAEITRLANVRFEDGTQHDFEEEEVRWLPELHDFPHWHDLMGGYLNLSEKELCDEEVTLFKQLREIPATETKTKSAKFLEVIKMNDRTRANNPWAYLTDEQQDTFIALLAKNSEKK